MSDPLILLAAGLTGAAIGVANAAGLWWTVRALVRSKRPAALALSSFVVRLALTVGLLVLVASGEVDRLIAALTGFLIARMIAVRSLGVDRPEGGKERAR